MKNTRIRAAGRSKHRRILRVCVSTGHGLLKGRHRGIDSSVIEANASLRELVHRNTEEQYWDYVKRLKFAGLNVVGLWSTTGNLSGGTVADVPTFNADFNTPVIAAENTVHRDITTTSAFAGLLVAAAPDPNRSAVDLTSGGCIPARVPKCPCFSK